MNGQKNTKQAEAKPYPVLEDYAFLFEEDQLSKSDYEDQLDSARQHLRSDSSITVPKKTVAVVKLLADADLKEIHSDVEVARELCLYFLSMMTQSYFNDDKQVRLHSQILRRMFRPLAHKHESDNTTYVAIRKVLLKGTKKNGAIIGHSTAYSVGSKSQAYWLAEGYSKVGFLRHDLTTPYVKSIVARNYYEKLAAAASNTIASNLFRFYATMTLPTPEEALALGAELAKAKHKTKKGKTLTMAHRQPQSYWKDAKERSFVEFHLERYGYYINDGLMVPVVGGERSGGRVYDSISLMPSWIRAAITVDGKPIVEHDYKALHPNLAMKIYGGGSKYVTHGKVAAASGVARDEVKIEHLSFFNRTWSGMERSPLYAYYMTNEPAMMEAICVDKAENKHTITSRKMFALEVELVTEVVRRLNILGIYVGYAYDALYSSHLDAAAVENMMNVVAYEMNIYTATVEVNDEQAHEENIALESVKDAELFEVTEEKHFSYIPKKNKQESTPDCLNATMSFDEVMNQPTFNHDNDTPNHSNLAPPATTGGAEALGQPQNSIHTEPAQPAASRGDEPRPADGDAEPAEGRAEQLEHAAGRPDGMAGNLSEDLPGDIQLQAGLDGPDHEGAGAVRRLQGPVDSAGVGAGAGVASPRHQDKWTMDFDQDAAHRRRQSPEPAKPRYRELDDLKTALNLL